MRNNYPGSQVESIETQIRLLLLVGPVVAEALFCGRGTIHCSEGCQLEKNPTREAGPVGRVPSALTRPDDHLYTRVLRNTKCTEIAQINGAFHYRIKWGYSWSHVRARAPGYSDTGSSQCRDNNMILSPFIPASPARARHVRTAYKGCLMRGRISLDAIPQAGPGVAARFHVEHGSGSIDRCFDFADVQR